MSNEQKQPAKPEPTVTRIPVKHLYFTDNTDVQGQSQLSNLKCWREPEGAAQWYTCDFIPAWQQFELTWHRNQVEPEVRLMPACHVRTWKRA